MKHWMLVASLLLLFELDVRAQSFPTSRINWAREFLRATYPDLNQRKYVLSIQTAISYDDPESPMGFLLLDVGEGNKFFPISCCFGGYASTPPAPQLPYPPELGPLPPPSPVPLLRKGGIARPPNVDEHGRVFSKQYLSATFTFDKNGRLRSLTAQGPAVEDREADNKLSDQMNSSPEMSEEDIVAMLKESGIRYGPGDKEQFERDLPLKKLEPFLGSIKLISVHFSPLSENRALLYWWPDWTVAISAVQSGVTVDYKLSFDRRTGRLTGIQAVP